MIIRRLAFTAFLIAFGGLTQSTHGAVSVWPLEHHIHSHPNEPAQAVVKLRNRSEETQVVHLYLTDWEPDDPTFSTLPAGTGSRSLAAFVSRSLPPQVVLEPGEVTTVTLEVVRPPDDRGTRWSSITVESDPVVHDPTSAEAGGSVTVRLRRRQRVRVHHTPLPLEPALGRIERIARNPDRPGYWEVDYANVTDRVFPLAGEWRLSDTTGRVVASQEISRRPAYPGTGQVMIGPAPPLSPGVYHLLVILHPADTRPNAGSAGHLVVRVEGIPDGDDQP